MSQSDDDSVRRQAFRDFLKGKGVSTWTLRPDPFITDDVFQWLPKEEKPAETKKATPVEQLEEERDSLRRDRDLLERALEQSRQTVQMLNSRINGLHQQLRQLQMLHEMGDVFSGGPGSAPSDRELKQLVIELHPDKHPSGMVSATEVTAKINALRDKLAGRK